MANYLVAVHATPATTQVGIDPLGDAAKERRAVRAACARVAACEVASRYVNAGMTVDWVRQTRGLREMGQRWRGRFIADVPRDGDAGVREPRRPGHRRTGQQQLNLPRDQSITGTPTW